jgi:hypothetical protein
MRGRTSIRFRRSNFQGNLRKVGSKERKKLRLPGAPRKNGEQNSYSFEEPRGKLNLT